uniref:hypothetical protein n=1 Tax=Mycoplasmopsis bovis TaxID=28903 RepID=UPI003D2D0227
KDMIGKLKEKFDAVNDKVVFNLPIISLIDAIEFSLPPNNSVYSIVLKYCLTSVTLPVSLSTTKSSSLRYLV